MKTLKNKPFYAVYDNTGLDAFIPEQWAMEGVAILLENMVAANLVHRDFEPLFARYGDVVNTRKPGEFVARRKTNSDDVDVQDASATNIPVPLDQHVHVSFLIRDGEESKSFKSLVDEYLRPAAIAMARNVDQMVLGQYAQFLANQAGTLGGLSDSNADEYITGVRQVLNLNKAFMDGRNLILTPDAETKMLQNANFINAEKAGDQGTALREASLGRKFGFDTFMCQNMAAMPLDTSVGTGAIDNGNVDQGSTVLTVDGFGSGEVVPGDWITIGGHVYHVTATDNATATQLTLEWGLVAPTVNDAAISVYDRAAIDFSSYPAGYAKYLLIDNASGDNPATTLHVGQLITIGTQNNKYVVLDVVVGATEDEILLDRPLDAAVSNNDVVHYGPPGNYNFAFHKNAIALVIRPLALPRAGTGALSGVANFNGATMRTTITYDGTKQGHLVTLDFLAGIKVLDTDLGAVMLS